MVMPILYGLGARDFLEPMGFVVYPCQKCGTHGPFTVFEAKRKVTFFAIPTVSVREQLVIECRACRERFGVPNEMRDDFLAHLMSEEELLARLRRARVGAGAGNGYALAGGVAAGPTYYQVLQVDPAADPDVIEAAFRRLALKYHPDKSTDPKAAAKMRALLEAKDCLADPRKRRAYDASIGLVRRPPAMRADDV